MFARLFPILGITFIDILGFSILIPILPFYVEHFHAGDVVVGTLFATFAFCQFLAGPLWGAVSDRIGRKRVLIVSQIGATVGWAGLAFAGHLWLVFLARIVEGISGGNISVTQAYVADRVDPAERPRAFALIGAAFSAGLVLGPTMGGTLLTKFGYATPFLLAAGLQVVTLGLTIFFLPEEVADHGEAAPSASFRDVLRFLRDRDVSPILVQKFAFSLGLYAWFAAFSLVLKKLMNFGPAEVSYAFAIFGVFSIVIQLGVVGRVTDRIGVRATSNLGFLSLIVFFTAICFAHTWLALVGIVVFFAAGLAFTNATIATLLTNAAPERVRGTVLGVGSSLESVSGFLTPTLSTALLATFAVPGPAALSIGFVGVALALGLIAKRNEPVFRAEPAP